MTEPKSAEEIRARLNEIAPYRPATGVTATSLARWFAMEAQVVWARMLDVSHSIDPRDIGTLHGYFAAAHVLLEIATFAPAAADNVAQVIAEAIDSPGDTGEWIWEYHGDHASEIADLARRLAALTEVDTQGHLHVREPASP